MASTDPLKLTTDLATFKETKLAKLDTAASRTLAITRMANLTTGTGTPATEMTEQVVCENLWGPQGWTDSIYGSPNAHV